MRNQMMRRKRADGWMDGWMEEEGRDSRRAPWEIGLSMHGSRLPAVTEPPVQIQKRNLSTSTHAMLRQA